LASFPNFHLQVVTGKTSSAGREPRLGFIVLTSVKFSGEWPLNTRDVNVRKNWFLYEGRNSDNVFWHRRL